jgi:DNA mismatch endonuclease (patch repair protein)
MDVALPRKKRVVFIDGDFWHGRTVGKLVERRGDGDFWVEKIRRNMARDARQRELLANNGWKMMTVWESDLMRKRTREQALDAIVLFLSA